MQGPSNCLTVFHLFLPQSLHSLVLFLPFFIHTPLNSSAPSCMHPPLLVLLVCFLLSATTLHPQKAALCITLFGIFIHSHKLSLVSTSRALTLKSLLFRGLTSSIYMQLLLGISSWRFHWAPQSPKSQGKTHCPWKFISSFFLTLLIDISSEIIKQNFTFSFPLASHLFCAMGFSFMTFFSKLLCTFSSTITIQLLLPLC